MADYYTTVASDGPDFGSTKDPIPDLLDAHPVTKGQIGVFGFAFGALILEGLDIQLLAFFTPLILAEWGLDRAVFGPALAAALVGMAIGASVGGWVGDGKGRRPVIVASVFVFGLGTAALSITHDLVTLAVLRFFSGMAFGAAIPNAYALTSEWLPRRTHARAIGANAISSPLGGVVGAVTTLAILSLVGWRWCFALSGIATMVLALGMFAWLPESASIMLHRGRNEMAARELKRIAGVSIVLDPLFLTNSMSRRSHRDTIFVPALARLNGGGALAFFTLNFVTAAISSWAPTILTAVGLPITNAISGSLLFNSLAIGGGLFTASMIPRWGSKPLLIGTALACLVTLVITAVVLHKGILSSGSFESYFVVVLIGLIGLFVGAAFTVSYMIVSAGYPAPERATGIGFSATMGRVGSVAAVLAGGMLLKMGGTTATPLFVVLSAFITIAAAAAFVIDRHIFPSIAISPGRESVQPAAIPQKAAAS